jgi:hypothetical protein
MLIGMSSLTRPSPTHPRARSWWGQPGLVFKRLTLLIGAVYFTFVALTNVVDSIATIGGYHWTFLNSGNESYIASITKVYSLGNGFNRLAVVAAAVVEAVGALLFWRAVWRYRGAGSGVAAAWQALTWNVLVWLGFIAGTEFFVAYTSEAPFRELLMIGLAMAVVIAVVPDDPTRGTPIIDDDSTPTTS